MRGALIAVPLLMCAVSAEQVAVSANSATTSCTTTGQLTGKVAIITGASRGVGAEIAKVYAREGANVVVNYYQSKDKADAIVADINSRGEGRAIALYGDVTSKADMVTMVAAATEAFGAVHVLVNNALAHYQFNPASKQASIKTIEWSDFDHQMKGTVAGAVNAVQACLPAFEAQGFGKVVMIGTNLVYNPVVTYYDYTSAKAALVGLTRNLAAELGEPIQTSTQPEERVVVSSSCYRSRLAPSLTLAISRAPQAQRACASTSSRVACSKSQTRPR